MQVVLTHISSADRRERIYACQIVAIRDAVLIGRCDDAIMHFPFTEIASLVSVQNGEEISLAELSECPQLNGHAASES